MLAILASRLLYRERSTEENLPDLNKPGDVTNIDRNWLSHLGKCEHDDHCVIWTWEMAVD